MWYLTKYTIFFLRLFGKKFKIFPAIVCLNSLFFQQSFSEIRDFSHNCLPKIAIFSTVFCQSSGFFFSVMVCRYSRKFQSMVSRNLRFFFSQPIADILDFFFAIVWRNPLFFLNLFDEAYDCNPQLFHEIHD